ncbi:MAG: hypothetical protein JRC92_07525 [Deltaproteobacteria bacterium]|nr:hypothetical protein [Deltaproteobacteria bacterium]
MIYPSTFPKGSAFNWLMGNEYGNPELDELLAKAGEIADHDKRMALYTKAVEIINDDCPMIWYSVSPMPCGWRDYVKGFVPHVGNGYNYADGGLMYTWLDK